MTRCPLCKLTLRFKGTVFVCNKCRQEYPVLDGILVVYPGRTARRKELIDYYNKEYTNHIPLFHLEEGRSKAKDIMEILPKGFKCDSLLDLGCGAGRISLDLKKSLGVKRIVFLDIVLDALKLVPKSRSNEYYVGMAESLPLGNNSVDFTIALDLLEHAENPEKVISEISRCSRFLLLKSPLEKSFMRNLLHKVMNVIYGKKYWKRIFGHINQFDRKDLYNMLERNGFVIKRQKLSTHIAESVNSPLFRVFLYIQKIAFVIMPKPIFERIFGGHLWIFAERE